MRCVRSHVLRTLRETGQSAQRPLRDPNLPTLRRSPDKAVINAELRPSGFLTAGVGGGRQIAWRIHCGIQGVARDDSTPRQ